MWKVDCSIELLYRDGRELGQQRHEGADVGYLVAPSGWGVCIVTAGAMGQTHLLPQKQLVLEQWDMLGREMKV